MMLENTTDENPVANEPDPVVGLTSRVVSAYVVNHTVPTTTLPDLIAQTFHALKGLGQEPVAHEVLETKKPAVPIRQSIQGDYLISLENGQKFKSLKRHLQVQYGMSPEDYRSRWGLPKDYPMVAPAYAAKRSELAKGSGLGTGRASSTATKTKTKEADDA
jgi:predicted transcriptional regulator